MNEVREMLQSLTERFAATANVKQVFGEPIPSHGRTIVPVARVSYHAGAGWGGEKGDSLTEGRGGGGGGGAVHASPAGVLEISDGVTRFVPFIDPKTVAALLGGGLLLGLVAGRLFSRRDEA